MKKRVSPETITHKKMIREGFYILKKQKSKYWTAKIYVPETQRYIIRSTKEVDRVDALEVAKEIEKKLSITNTISTPRHLTLEYFAEELMKVQVGMSGNGKSKSYAYDDEKIINRKSDGIIASLGKKNVREFSTYNMRNYLSLLDRNRKNGMSASSKSKHLNIISKILKLAYEKNTIDKLPLLPQVKKEDKPRPSFSETEYKKFLKTATEEIKKNNVMVRGILLTEEMYLTCVFIVHTFLRPAETELFALKHRDVEVVGDPKHLRLKLKKGKTGHRIVSSMPLGVDFYNKLYEFNSPYGTKQDDYIIQPTYRNRTTAKRNLERQVTYVLEKCNLKVDPFNQNRVPYSFRHYALQTRLIKSKGKVNIYTLAKNAGTSVNQLERFYLKNLELDDETVKNLQTF